MNTNVKYYSVSSTFLNIDEITVNFICSGTRNCGQYDRPRHKCCHVGNVWISSPFTRCALGCAASKLDNYPGKRGNFSVSPGSMKLRKIGIFIYSLRILCIQRPINSGACNGGDCADISSGGFVCSCPFGWGGDRCEERTKITRPGFRQTRDGHSFITLPKPKHVLRV